MLLILPISVPTKFDTLLCHSNPLDSRLVKAIFPKFCLYWEFLNWVITVVSEHDINTFYEYIFMFPNYDLPPLDTVTGDINSEREESGEVSSFYKEIKAKL